MNLKVIQADFGDKELATRMRQMAKDVGRGDIKAAVMVYVTADDDLFVDTSSKHDILKALGLLEMAKTWLIQDLWEGDADE